MVMHNPPHPGEVVRKFCIEPLGLSVTEAAKGLGVSRSLLSELLNGRRGFAVQPDGSPVLDRSIQQNFLISPAVRHQRSIS
jgi:predicted transcriptional regulator